MKKMDFQIILKGQALGVVFGMTALAIILMAGGAMTLTLRHQSHTCGIRG